MGKSDSKKNKKNNAGGGNREKNANVTKEEEKKASESTSSTPPLSESSSTNSNNTSPNKPPTTSPIIVQEEEKEKVDEETSSSSPPLKEKCSLPNCLSLGEAKCGSCSKASYCCREHQKLHWKEHKGACTAWRVDENKTLGRHLIAMRDVKAGEIILREKPLLVTPPKITLPVCLGCYSEFRPDGAETDDGHGVKPFACRNGCGWPMCKSPLCSNSRDHGPECTLAKARGKVTVRNADTEHPMYQLIGILRALGLREKDPSTYATLMSLEAHVAKRQEMQKKVEKDTEEYNMQFGESSSGSSGGIFGPNSGELKSEVGLKMMRDFFHIEDISEEWILQLMGIIETNGHEIPIPDQDGHINRRVIGVYHNASFMEHNCVPNCLKTWDLATKEIIIRSSIHIKKGDHLSISYVDPLWGTNDRLSLLRLTKFFSCTCSRCKDPSELGTHISSLKCQHLKCMNRSKGTGSLIPVLPSAAMIVPTDPYSSGETLWKCVSCSEEYNNQYVISLVHSCANEMETLHQKVGDIKAKEDFLRKFGKTLSPNHFHLLEVKVELAQLYGRVGEDLLHLMKPKSLLRKIQICEELLLVFNIICPGYNRLRALIIYELQAAFLMLSRVRRGVGEISMEKHLEDLMQCGKWMTEVIKVLGWESHNSIERKRAAGAEQDLEMLKSAVLSLQPAPTPPPPPPTTTTKKAPEDTKKESVEESRHNSNHNNSKDKQKKKEEDNKDNDKDKDGGRSHLTVDEDSFIEEVF